MENLFENTFVLTLDTLKEERWNDFEKEIGKIPDIKFEEIQGVIINGGKTTEDRDAGCRMGHHKIVSLAKERNLEYICVFEDDLKIFDHFNNHLDVVRNFISTHQWEMFYLGGTSWWNTLQETDNNQVFKTSRTLCTHAYLIHNSCYDIAMNACSSYNVAIDTILGDHVHPRGKSYVINPPLVGQRYGYSYIRDGYRKYTILEQINGLKEELNDGQRKN